MNHDSATDEDPEEELSKNYVLDKELYNKKKKSEEEDIPELKSSKIKNRKQKDET